jgi:hypothetical protein
MDTLKEIQKSTDPTFLWELIPNGDAETSLPLYLLKYVSHSPFDLDLCFSLSLCLSHNLSISFAPSCSEKGMLAWLLEP